MKEELRPCPFCGGPGIYRSRASDCTNTGQFHTIKCDCGGHVARAWVGASTKEEARRLWNRRRLPLDEIRERLRERVEHWRTCSPKTGELAEWACLEGVADEFNEILEAVNQLENPCK